MKPPLFLCVMLLSSSVAAQNDHQRQKDSLWNAAVHSEGVEKLDTYARLTNYYFAEKGDQKKRDTLFSLYDLIDRESEKLGGHEERRVKVRANRLIVLTGYDAQLYDQAIALAPDYLSFAAERNAWDIYYQIYRAYISAYWNQKDNDTALALAKEMYEDAKERGSNAGMGIAFYMMSRIYSTQQRSEEEEECLREAIELTKGKESVINILVDAYTLLGGCLIEQKRYEEAKRFTGEWEEAIAVYEGIINQPSIVARANQLLIYTQACIGLKQFDEAERCCSKIDSLTNGVQVLYVERAAIFAERREYDKALEMIDKAIEAISPAYKIDPMGKKLVILIQKGDSEGAKQLFDEVIEFLKSTHSEQLNAQLDEIRTLHQVDKINAQKERLRTILIFSFGLCIFLTIALGIWIYYSRVVVKKNRGLYRQIKEQEMMANELEAMAKQYEALAQGHP
ncbi:MAG: hypothetical protein FWG54_00925, partial [Bacteroidetes bacterium]|nr:hypothetical protein [Bacteroidota bacterium]